MKCPTCKGPAARGQKFFPFCGERCQLVDLGRWLDEEFRVSEPAGTADQAPTADADRER